LPPPHPSAFWERTRRRLKFDSPVSSWIVASRSCLHGKPTESVYLGSIMDLDPSTPVSCDGIRDCPNQMAFILDGW